MNLTQQKYAMQRVSQIEAGKLSAIKIAMPKKETKVITYGELAKLIKTGKIQLNTKMVSADRIIHSSEYVTNVFDTSEFHKPKGYGESDIDTDAYEKKIAPIKKEAQAIRDKIMLGDAEEALRLIVAFEK
jgi:hypothetical protein